MLTYEQCRALAANPPYENMYQIHERDKPIIAGIALCYCYAVGCVYIYINTGDKGKIREDKIKQFHKVYEHLGQCVMTVNCFYEYQKLAFNHQLTTPKSMLWLGMGLGKTPITLTSIVARMNIGVVKKTLIFAPLRVIYSVWKTEALKWDHTKDLSFSIIHGSEKQRKAALFRDVDVYLINYEGMNWLAEAMLTYYKDSTPFDFVVYDEITKVKNSQSKRISGGKREILDQNGESREIKITGWKKVFNFKFTTGLTGSPSSNGLIDLFGQYLVLDQGARLGEYITHFRNAYCQKDYDGWTWKIVEQAKPTLYERIGDITIKMDAAEYLDLPACKVTDIFVELPVKIRKQYKQLEDDLFTELDSGIGIELFNKVSLSNKCLQFANGATYVDELGRWEKLHDAKLDALADMIEDANGSPILLGYNFKSDAARIEKKFKGVVNLTTSKNSETPKILKNWQDGKIKILIGHPASIGHGIDGLQKTGCIVVWFGCPWSLELYEQLNARINRNGQTKSVSIIRILCSGTVDLAVVEALESKDTTQENLKKSIQEYRLNNKS